MRRYTGDPTYRYADFENAINRLGYEELGARRTPNAPALFARTSPRSSSPDSAAAYRQALQLAPNDVKPRIRAIVAELGG
ncbi:MAG: hypothetical protein M3N13_02635 [Candidatus Eremiobacteraeota bacterium]|nr:hypothetical protein [Candidatus Eremiobacteraeota bacterium]